MCLIASYPAKEKAEAPSTPEPCNLSPALWNTGPAPSRIAQTTRDRPRRMSPAENTLGREV